MKFELPKLEYEYNSLEPYIDEETMKLHHTKHHQIYTDKFNEALSKHPEINKKNAEEIIKELDKIPEDIKIAVRNHGGGYVNHNFFWKILRKNTEINGKIKKSINENFSDFENFKKEFSNAALGVFGSGWAWLVINPVSKKLEIIKTSNQDSPLTLGKIPLLCIDVWEHAYYLKYQNRRAEYVEAFFNVINWKKVEENFIESLKIKMNINKWNELADKIQVELTMSALNRNGIKTYFAKNIEEAKKKVLELIPDRAEVMDMSSETLRESGIAEEIAKSKKYIKVREKLMSMDRKNSGREMQRMGASPEYAIGSANAVTEDGKIMVVSNTGSQLPAYVYGADKVIFVVGTQKIVKNTDEAMKRIYEYVLPLESERARKAYGVDGSFVSKVLLINREIKPERISLIFVNEKLGY